MELQVGVKVLLKNKEGKYLLVKRSSRKYPEIGPKWDIVGGRIDAGKTLLENLKREIKEEVGLDLEYNPIFIAAQDIMDYPEKHVVRLTYTAVIDGNPILSDEHTEFGWFTTNEMKDMRDLDIYFKEVLEKDLLKTNAITAVKAIIEKDGLFLVLKKNIAGERWDIPGGKVQVNESTEQALLREVKEETGLSIRIERLLGTWYFMRSDNNQVICITYLCRGAGDVDISKNINENFNVEDFKWVSKRDFLDKYPANKNLKEFIENSEGL